MVVVFALYGLLYLGLTFRYFTGYWYTVAVITAYLCLTPLFLYIINYDKDFDTSYENIRKPVKFSI